MEKNVNAVILQQSSVESKVGQYLNEMLGGERAPARMKFIDADC